MPVEFYINVEDAAGNILGPGPITSATDWESTGRMDRAGAFRFTMPASDPKASLISEKRRVRCFAYLDSAWVEIGDGIIDQVDTQIGDDGTVMLAVSGQDGAYQLAGMNALYLELASGSGPVPVQTGINTLLSNANFNYSASLTADFAGVSANPDVYARFAGESMLQAIGMTAKSAGYHWRWQSVNSTLIFFDAFQATGVRAVRAHGPLAAETCAITSISRSIETHELYTHIVPFGGGQGRARLTLQPSNRTVPPGYNAPWLGLPVVENYIERDAAVAQYGRIDRWVEFKEIVPLSNTDADLQAAANYLFDVALLELDRNSVRATHYNLEVAQCRQVLRPGQSIRVLYRDVVAGLDIDETLNIIEATIRLDSDGLRTTRLTVSDLDRWPLTDSDLVANRLAEGRIFQAHPQLNANSYVQSYTKNVDEVETATFRFRFGAEVVQLQQVQFEFQLLPLESTVRTVAVQSMTGGSGQLLTDPATGATGNPSNNTSGAPSTNTSGAPSTNTSGGPSVADTSGPSVTDTGSGGGGSTDSGGSGTTGTSGSGTTGSGGAGLTGASGTGSTGSGGGGDTSSGGGGTSGSGGGGDTSGAQGGDTVSAGRHSHGLGVGAYAGGGNALFLIPSGSNSQIQAQGATGTVPLNISGEHTHSVSSHSHSVSSHTHSIDSHTHSFGDHTHSVGNHTHTFGDHTHSIPSHSHTLSAHTHGLAAHTHSLGAHTHAMGNHTHNLNDHTHTLGNHTHSLNNHTHTMTPTLITSYGIFRDSALDTYGASELEYRVNSGAWLPLSGATNVGSGWFRLDVTDALYNVANFRPLQEANTVQIRAAAPPYTITDIQGTGPNLVIQTSPAPDSALIGRQIRVAGTVNYNGVYTVMDVDSGYIIILQSITGPQELTGTVAQVKKATIDAQLSVRNTIQAIAYL